MIRPATAADLTAIEEIYSAILTIEETTGPVYTNWQRGKYPTLDTARDALEKGFLFVGEENGTLWGVVTLNGIQLPEYNDIPWSIHADKDAVGVIHTLCIHPQQTGHGYARQMVAFSEDLFRSQGKTALRLDTWEHNVPANHLYPSLGYSFAGATEFFFMGFVHEILNCYEKAL